MVGLQATTFATQFEERSVEAQADLARLIEFVRRTAGTQGPGSIVAGHISAGAITAGAIAAGSITTAHLQAGAVVASTIAAGTITADRIATNTLTANEIAASAITTSELAADSVISSKIVAGTIVASDIAAATITASRIAANTITAGQITAGTITATEIAAATITATQIAAATITGALIAAGTLTATNIAAGTITATQIAAATITGDRIVGDTITATQIAASAITTSELAAGSVTAAKIVAGTITATEIAAATITAGNIVAATITGAKIAAATITATNIAAGTITGALIAAGTITGDRLVAGTITATQITVATLSAISANLGTITAGTVTGATFQTAAANPRVVMDATGIYALDAAGVVTFKADASTGKIITLAGLGGGNLLKNASFEDGAIGTGTPPKWAVGSSATTAAIVATPAKHGVKACELRRTAATGAGELAIQTHPSHRPLVQEGEIYTATAWVQAASVARDAQARIYFYDVASGGTSISNVTGAVVTETVGEYVRVEMVATAPATAISATVRVLISAVPEGELHYVDAVQGEEGRLATAFAPKPDEILPATVTGGAGTGEIATGTIVGGDLVADTVTATQIAAGAVTAVEILALTITAGQIAAGTITAAKITAGTITTTEIAAATIVASDIATDTITATQIAANAVTTSEIAATTIIAGDVAANTLTAGQIAASTITTTEILAATILAADIASGTITATQIAAGTITADRMNVTQLSAIVADLGTVTAGTITGGVIRTASSGARVELSGTSPVGLKKYDASGNVAVKIGQTDGLDLLAGTTASPPNDRRVRWLTGAGAEVASASAYEVSGTQTGTFRATSPDGTKTASITPYASDTGQVVSAQAGGITRTVIAASGFSGFLQLTASAQIELDFLADTMTGDGTRRKSKTINHALGRTPQVVMAVAASDNFNASAVPLSSTQLSVSLNHVDGTVWSSAQTFYWLALG